MTDRARVGHPMGIAIVGAVLAAATMVAAPASAQGATDEFGIVDATVTTLLASSFNPRFSADGYEEDIDGWLNATNISVPPIVAFRAGLAVPTGASLTSFELEACDTDPASDLSAFLFACGPAPGSLCFLVSSAIVNPQGTPGCGRFAAIAINHVVDNRDYSYMVEVWDRSTAASTRFRAVRIFWRRLVSPSPAQPTFGDVGPSHFAYQFVEALARAGITGGCTPTQYCPDAAVTRAQGAVFLAVALGLHWPN